MKKELSEEDMEKAEEARALNVKNTLESKLFQGVLGSNSVLTNQSLYGALGVNSAQSTYDDSMSSKEIKEIRDKDYQERAKEYRARGVFGEPAYPSNGDVSNKIIRQIDEIMAVAKLGELEKIAKDAGAKLTFEVPEDLKNYSEFELIQKAYNQETGKLDLKVLSDKEQIASGFYQTLVKEYQRACVFKTIHKNFFTDLNAEGEALVEAYNNKYKKEDKVEKVDKA